MAFRRCSLLAGLMATSFLHSAWAAPPTASVTVVSLPDLDLDKDELGGTVSWTAPPDTTQVTKYNVYLATSALGAGKSILQLNVPVGTNTINVAENTALGSFMYVVVMTANADGEQTNAPGSALLEDHVAVINSLSFTDFDLDTGHIGGPVAWSLRGTAPVSQYNVYLAEDGLGGNKVLQSEVLSGTSYQFAADTAYGTHSFICVYAASTLGEASRPSAIQFYDVDSPVRNLAFTDLDLDVGELGGRISWVAPQDSVEVTRYVVTSATSAAGAGRNTLGSSALGAGAYDVSPNMVHGSYTHFNVYSESSLAEMTTPVSIPIVDNVVTVSDIAFQDVDLDANELGGVVSWNATGDTSYAVSYDLYLATTATGSFRSRVGTDSLDLQRVVNTGTSKANYQYFVVYATSSLVQQSTPASMLIADVASWNMGSWSSCSAACGSGTQTRSIACSSATAGACGSVLQPETTRSCTNGACSWSSGSWGVCSRACGEGVGTQTRTVACSSAAVNACDTNTQPNATRSCSSWCPWTSGVWGGCSRACGQGIGTQTRAVACSSAAAHACDNGTQPDAARQCSSFCPWTSGAWSACNCQTKTMTRSMTCSTGTESQCGSKPASEEACAPTGCAKIKILSGCRDNGDHDAMRPWGRAHNMSCGTQWWLIFWIIVVSILLFCCCFGVLIRLTTKKSVAPQKDSTAEKAEKPEAPQQDATAEKDEKGVEVSQEMVDLIEV